MRILVCGGRNYNDYEQMREVLFQNVYPGDTIIHGDARGADKLSEEVAQPYVTFERYPANWSEYGKSAGYVRNKLMLEQGKPDLVIAFPGGKGTANMVELATKANIPVRYINGHN